MEFQEIEDEYEISMVETIIYSKMSAIDQHSISQMQLTIAITLDPPVAGNRYGLLRHANW